MQTSISAPFVIPALAPRRGLLARIKASLAKTRAAHDAVRRIAALPAGACRDAGLGAEDLLGLPLQQDALPFFLQPGFGQHRER